MAVQFFSHATRLFIWIFCVQSSKNIWLVIKVIKEMRSILIMILPFPVELLWDDVLEVILEILINAFQMTLENKYQGEIQK